MKKLRSVLWNKPFCNDCHFFLVAVVLLVISLKHPLVYFALLIYLFWIGKKTSYLFPILGCLGLILVSFWIKKSSLKPITSGIHEAVFIVEDYQDQKMILKGDTKIIIYGVEDDFKPGDRIEATVQVKQLSTSSYTGDFNEQEYYFSKGITNKGTLIQYQKIGERFSIARLRYHILDFYKRHLGEKNYQYVSTIFFGRTALEEGVKEAYQSFYCTHVLVISGLHILFLHRMLKKIFQKGLHIEGSMLSLLLLGGYLVLIGIPVSALRAYLFLLIGYFNRRGSILYTKLDILSISFLLMMLWNPFWCYQQGFILSFLVSFLLLFKEEFQPYQGWKGSFFQSILCILTTLPFVINQSYELSITGLLVSFFIACSLSRYLLPAVFIMMMLPFPIYEPFFQGLDTILLFLNQYSITFGIPAFSFVNMVIYYVLFILFLVALVKKKRRCFYLVVMGLYILILSNLKYGYPFYKVTFIDVGQGDSILIEAPHHKETILIDSYSNLDYLESIALKKIDYIFLTHLDYDHSGTVEEVVRCYTPKTLYYPIYETTEKLKGIPCEKIPIKGYQKLFFENITIEVLGPLQSYEDANSNSLVCKIRLLDTTFLMTGDMTMAAEQNLLQHYSNQQLKTDILKVAHHGSDTSTCEAFLKAVNPEISIISVGKDNAYHLPNATIYQRLAATSTVYMTKDRGNIEVIVGKKYWVRPFHS